MMMVGLAVVTLEMATFSSGLKSRPPNPPSKDKPDDPDESELRLPKAEDEDEEAGSSIISCRMCSVDGDSNDEDDEETLLMTTGWTKALLSMSMSTSSS